MIKQPQHCLDLQEIRKEIDDIDKHIIDLIGLRYEYVKEAAKFKKDEQAVRAPERFAALLSQRRAWADAIGLSGDIIEKLFRDLVNYFIDQEFKHFEVGNKENH
jgi:isochorismate pyruvate lyase